MTRQALADGTVLTMDEAGTIYDDGAVVWEGSELTFVGPHDRRT